MENKSYMLTPCQRQAYDYWKLDPADDTLVIEPSVALSYDTDVEALVTEAERLIDDIVVLHARVVEIGGEPRLIFDPAVRPMVEVCYVSDAEAEEIIDHRHVLPDLNRGPMAHFMILVTPTRKFIRASISNLLCDGWSICMITNRLPLGTLQHWTSISETQNSFPAYLEQLEAQRQSPRFERDRAWWMDYMKGVDRLTDFAIQEEYEDGKVILKKRIFDKTTLNAACQQQQCMLSEALLTAWAMALRDMTAGDEAHSDITLITLNRGRTRQQMDALGNYIVEKALRVDVAAEDHPTDVLQKVRHANFVTNLHCLFTEQDLEPYIGDRDQGTCVLYNEGMDHAESVVEGEVIPPRYTVPTKTCEFLTGILWGRQDTCELEVTYSEPLYREEDVERFVVRVEHWIREILKF